MRQPSVLGIVSYQVFPAQMGGQKCVVDFYTHLSKITPVTLAVTKENAGASIRDVPVFSFLYHHKWGFANLRYVYRLQKIIKQQKIDVVLIEHSYLGWLGMLLKWLTKKPFVIRSHNIEAHRFRDMRKPFWQLYGWYEKRVHKKADHSFFITEANKQWAITHWELDAQKCSVVTYGTDYTKPVAQEARTICRKQLLSDNYLDPATRLYLFSGTLDYLPNTDALRVIISELLPILQSMPFSFRIFICGNRLSEQWKKVLRAYPSVIYKGFVPDIGLYNKGADCFINPVTLGSGIKIKLVDALSYNQSCVSTRSGAIGIEEALTAGKMSLSDDYDWPAFVRNMVSSRVFTNEPVPEAFYQFFYWDTIVQKALLSLQTV
ncbi:MAG: glycosyltransferase family 4 protein [Bacteroidota bacterium]